MKNLKKEFPILSQNTYLNTAASGLLYDSLLDFRNEHDLDFLIGGSVFREKQQDLLNNSRNSINQFFGSNVADIVLTPNFSIGLNTVLSGLNNNQKVLLLDDDYPSLNFAAMHHGFEIYYATIDEHLEDNIEKAIVQNKPDIFIFSIVQYITGTRIDLNFIQQLKTTYPHMLIIADGTQFCGTVDFDFKKSGIDILGCSGYKWLLGGYGNGFLLFNKDVLDKITPDVYKKTGDQLDYDVSYTNLRARFECGHLDTFNFCSLQYSLDFLSKIGIQTIEEKISTLTTYAKEELTKLGMLEQKVILRKQHSSIFNIKGDTSLFNRLLEKDIICSQRGKGIRISLHFYNSQEDIDKLLSILHRYR